MLIKSSSQLTKGNNVCTLNEFFEGFYPLWTLTLTSSITQLIRSFLIPKATGTNSESPHVSPSMVIERTVSSRAVMFVSTTNGLTSRTMIDLATASLMVASVALLASSLSLSSGSSYTSDNYYLNLRQYLGRKSDCLINNK